MPDGQSGLRHQADADPKHAAEVIASRVADLEDGVRTSLDRMKVALERTRPDQSRWSTASSFQ